MLQKPTQFHNLEKTTNSLLDLYKKGKFKEIIRKDDELVQLYPDSTQILNILGSSHLALEYFQKAINNFKQALAVNSNQPEIFYNLGLSFHYKGNFRSALKSYKKALEIQPNYEECYCNMGMSLNELGNIKESINCFKKTIEINPFHVGAYYNLGLAYEKKREINLAILNYKKVIKLDPTFWKAYVSLGSIFLKNKKIKLSILYFQNALNYVSHNPEIYFVQALNYFKLRDFEKASLHFKKCIELDPDNQDALHLNNSLIGRNTNTAPQGYVKNLFNNYAKNFEHSLLNELDYKVPQEIRNLLKNKLSKFDSSILDLGCGTGLVGIELSRYCKYLEGVDISESMIELSKKKKIYNKLIISDISQYLEKSTLSFDYFIAADVFIYLGELDNIFSLIKNRNNKPGHLVFSTEYNEDNGYKLEKSGRFSHSNQYITSLCNKLGFSVINLKKIKLRKENNSYISGAIYNLKF
tara:strand:+ start:1589 stop:2992 length:1404 start_codon:yes stop_codon:yes gene_type:complete